MNIKSNVGIAKTLAIASQQHFAKATCVGFCSLNCKMSSGAAKLKKNSRCDISFKIGTDGLNVITNYFRYGATMKNHSSGFFSRWPPFHFRFDHRCGIHSTRIGENN